MNVIVELVGEAIKEKKETLTPYTAFEQLVRNYQDMLYGFIFSHVPDPETAKDIVQESFIIAFDRLET